MEEAYNSDCKLIESVTEVADKEFARRRRTKALGPGTGFGLFKPSSNKCRKQKAT